MEAAGYRVVADYHTHTRFSHGKGTVLENVASARARGLRAVAVSDHGPANMFGIGVPSLATFDEIRKEVNAARAKYPDMEVLLGVEANVVDVDGTLDVPESELGRFDVVLAGLHPFVRWKRPLVGWSLVARSAAAGWTGIGEGSARRLNTQALVNAVRRFKITVVTHPGYGLPIDTSELAEACAERGTAMEINARHRHTRVEYIKIARDAGARFALGSDAHEPARVGDVERAARLARAAGLVAGEIINCRPDGHGSEA